MKFDYFVSIFLIVFMDITIFILHRRFAILCIIIFSVNAAYSLL